MADSEHSHSNTDFSNTTSDGCPVHKPEFTRPEAVGGVPDWWPGQLNLKLLQQNPPSIDPMGEGFDYGKEFDTLDLKAVQADLNALFTDSKDWWPADFGNYAPFFIRMAWHAAGTYRTEDGRGGAGHAMQRFTPLNSWPDNANLDKARRLLWPVKQKYGQKLSWADLMEFAGNCALESMGFQTMGFGGGREDWWQGDDTWWGPERVWMAPSEQRRSPTSELDLPLAVTQMGLIYVNPEGPNGVPDPVLSAVDVRQTFKRMAMNDIETAALIVGGHTFGKTHGAGPQDKVGPPPAGAPLEQQDLGWKNSFGTGVGADTTSSGLEVTWTQTPTTWDNTFLENLYGYDWEAYVGTGGLWQWRPKDNAGADSVPLPFDEHRHHQPNMLTSDIALKVDPMYEQITRRWLQNPHELAEEFRKAWFKLIHRDLGPLTRYRGSMVPQQPQLFQDPIEPVTHGLIGPAEIATLKTALLASGLTPQQLIYTAWSAASCYRDSDMRGGANGGRIRLAPQRNWERNEPDELPRVIAAIEQVQNTFNQAQTGNVAVSFADLVVLGGAAGIEAAAKAAGHQVTVPFTPGRGDAVQEMTEIESFDALLGFGDGFRNFVEKGAPMQPEYLLLDKAYQLTLSAPEMTVLVGGLRALNVNYKQSPLGVLTKTPGALTTDFFRNLLDMSTDWRPAPADDGTFIGVDRRTGEQRWTASRVDLAFGWDAQLRATSEVYAAADATPKFLADFIAAWDKVMNLDRFDLRR
ncbi:catalase/peroxidase HPI [Nocardia sp. NPDC058666]|uniref:catalase/peroxidase HPI n=1 Tax=Nocardia sp. NPDC058666 TaxID=3346587 RepID=UPI003656C444